MAFAPAAAPAKASVPTFGALPTNLTLVSALAAIELRGEHLAAEPTATAGRPAQSSKDGSHAGLNELAGWGNDRPCQLMGSDGKRETASVKK